MSNLYLDDGPSLGRKVMLATTVYDSPDASYTFSIQKSREALHKAGLPTAYLLLSGNCHVDDARNAVVRDFLASDCSELVFLDADVSWEPEHLIQLCSHDCDVVGGVYPYRRETGDPSMPVRMIRDNWTPDENGLIEVEGLPTGFLRIRRHVLEAMAKDAKTFERSGTVPVIFERDIYNGGRRGGDIAFCMKWREMGGRLYAAANLRLGHAGKMVVRDSLAASLRRQARQSLAHVARRVREGAETADDYMEAIQAVDNPWCASRDVLACAVTLARKANGAILETGSGLSTVLMAAANPDQTVWCLEHDDLYAHMTSDMAKRAGIGNIALVRCPLTDEWYDLSEDWDGLPGKFAVALVDGPPRIFGDRMRFFDVFGDRVQAVLADDADDTGYADKLKAWAEAHSWTFERGEGRAALLRRNP